MEDGESHLYSDESVCVEGVKGHYAIESDDSDSNCFFQTTDDTKINTQTPVFITLLNNELSEVDNNIELISFENHRNNNNLIPDTPTLKPYAVEKRERQFASKIFVEQQNLSETGGGLDSAILSEIFDIQDFSNCNLESLPTVSVSDLIKADLNHKIRSRRKSSNSLSPSSPETDKSFQRSDEENEVDRDKIINQRYRNKIAARKSREKKKMAVENMKQSVANLETENKNLENELEELREELRDLREMYDNHVPTCVCVG